MANEVQLRIKKSTPIDMIVPNVGGIEKGTILSGADGRNASPNGLLNEPFAGVARREKITSDGRTRLSTFPKGSGNVYDMVCSGPVTIGDKLVLSGANQISGAKLATFSNEFGRALETGATGATIQVLDD